MKVKYILGATALSLVLAGTAYPQQEQEKEKPQQQEQKPAEQPKQKPAEQPKTQQRQEQQSANKHQQQEQKNEQKTEQKNQQEKEKQSARQNEQQKQPEQTNRERQDQQKQLTKQQQDEQKQQQRQQQQVAKQQRTDERDQHSNQGHGRIPDDRFRASFGREHHFRVGHFDNRRFQYGGYWFSFNEGWPVGWAYTDDFYIDFIDGQYYLIDLSRPGVQLLLVVD
jgi:hypothetical protein